MGRRGHSAPRRDPCHTPQVANDSLGFGAVSITVTTPVYEGPFDLLLHLILKEELELYEVQLSTIVDEFIAE